MSDRDSARISSIPNEAAIDETGVVVAFIRADIEEGEINVHWLPSLFSRPMPQTVREMIVEKLRFHADKLESGELEKEMQRFVSINNPGNRTEQKQ